MHDFARNIRDSIMRHKLLDDSGRPVIVGLSGGADPVALLWVHQSFGYTFIAAHSHCGLRGKESDRDRDHAMSTAHQLGAKWVTVNFDTTSYCRQHGLGIEEGCRRLRYEWFHSLIDQYDAQAIAVAHHRDDQVETFFINLLRSSGLKGLKGMLPRNGHIIRPMLDMSRSDVTDYLRDTGLSYVTDSSNLSDDFTRNRIRHNVIPALRTASPTAVDADRAVVHAMANIDESRRLLDCLVAERSRRYATATGGWNVADLRRNEPMAEAMLFAILAPLGFRRDITDAILAASDESGRRFIDSSGGEWLIHGGELRPYSKNIAPSYSSTNLRDLPLAIEEINPAEFHPQRDASVLYLDATALDGTHTWELRPWSKGDRIRPFGMNGSRLVSDLLSDAKVPVDMKQTIRVLTRDRVIIWVVGMRTSAHFTIGSSTVSVLKITCTDTL